MDDVATITAQVSRATNNTSMAGTATSHGTMESAQESLDMALARAELGDGPLRFAPPSPYSVEQVLANLSTADQKSLRKLKERWNDHQDKRIVKYGTNKKKVFDLPIQWHLRYLHLYAKIHKKYHSYYFSVEKAWAAEKKLDRRFLNLNVFNLKEQIQTKVRKKLHQRQSTTLSGRLAQHSTPPCCQHLNL